MLPIWKQRQLLQLEAESDQTHNALAPGMSDTNPLPLMRQRSREVSLAGKAPAASMPPSPDLAACAAARRIKDFEGCMLAARTALKKEASCGKAWAFLCWALFEMHRYDEARTECLRALAYRNWAMRDREGMAALRTSCLLLSELTPAVGDQLRDGWYQKRLRALYDAGELFEYERGPEDAFGNAARIGVTRDELSLLDNVSAQRLIDVRLGGDGAERDVPEGLLIGGNPANERKPLQACIGGPNFPIEQGLGGVVYLKSTILPFHCGKRFGPDAGPGRRPCYDGNGPCLRCTRDQFPEPTHRFPTWSPELAPGATCIQPHPGMDVYYSTDSVPSRLHQQLSAQLDALATTGGTYPMPQYHTLIDPNLNAVDDLWVPAEYDVSERSLVPIDLLMAVELACLAATGHRLPFGFGPHITMLATEGAVRAECAMRSSIPDIDPHKHVKLHTATQRLLGAALPLLAKMRRPSLLLPGPLQAVVKAQRIVLAEGEDYAGVWHEDGMNEHVVAVVLYYYRASSTLRGGSLEFCSKQTQALWSGDAGGSHGELENAAELAGSLPRCQVPVQEGTLVCFSNYAAVHRVLRMEAKGGGGSRDFMAFFIIDQRHPLPTPRTLPPRSERIDACRKLLVQQLQPRGTFGFSNAGVYSTGNGSVADVGWVANAGGTRVEESYPDAATLIDRLNINPPRIERGASMMLQGPRPPADEVVAYNAESGWAEAWVGEGGTAFAVYIHMNYGEGFKAMPPEDGVSEVMSFPQGMREFVAFIEERGFWTDEPVLQARVDGRAIELVVGGSSSWVLREQLQPIKKLRGLAEGERCELEPFLDEYEEAGDEEGDDASLPFDANAWAPCLAYLLKPDEPLEPLREARAMTNYRPAYRRHTITSQLFNIKVNAVELGWRALEKAANAAMDEVDAMEWR